MKAYEKLIKFDEEGNANISLGKDFGHQEARVVILLKDDEVTEEEWLKGAMKMGSFDFLNDPAEDIYTLNDGKPRPPLNLPR
jgi:hypothetical protein